MKKVIVYGVGNVLNRRMIEEFLSDEYEIIGYSDSNYTEDVLDGGEFIEPANIKAYNVEYVIVAVSSRESYVAVKEFLTANGVETDKLVYSKTFFDSRCGICPNMVKEIKGEVSSAKELKGIILGMSYSYRGIIKENLKKKFCDFSADGLDLYYNIELYKRIRNEENIKNLDTVFLVLPYYYFDYDMSKYLVQFTNNQIFQVYELGYHNADTENEEIKNYIANYEMFGKKYKAFYNVKRYQEVIKRTLLHVEELRGGVEHIWHRQYDETVKENKAILCSFLEELHERNVKICLIVPPFCLEAFDDNALKIILEKKKRFYNILESLDEKYKDMFQCYDYFDAYTSCRDYFYDDTHLNYAGAQAFTELLNTEVI